MLAASPVYAQVNLETTIWSAELTVSLGNIAAGCSNLWNDATIHCSNNLTDDDFTYDGETYKIEALWTRRDSGNPRLFLDKKLPSALLYMALRLDNAPFALDDAVYNGSTEFWWTHDPGPSWAGAQKVSVKLTTPAPPGRLRVYSDDGELVLFWRGPSHATSAGSVTGYDVAYKESAAADTAGTGGDPSTGWVARGGYAVHATAQNARITGLTVGTRYDVRVRATYAGGVGPWAQGTGTPQANPPTPSAPKDLRVTTGDAQLSMVWTAPSETVTGYSVHYTSAKVETVANGAAAASNDPASASIAWVVESTHGTTTSHTISALNNGTTYRVRVRSDNAGSSSAWVHGMGTPQKAEQQPVRATSRVRLSASPNPVAEGSSVTIAATLSRALSSSVTIPLTLTDESAEPEDHGTLTSISIASGATSGTGTITTNQDADEVDETFTVALGTLPSDVTAGNPSSVRIIIRDDDQTGETEETQDPPGDNGGNDPDGDPEDPGDDDSGAAEPEDPSDDDSGDADPEDPVGGDGTNSAPETAATIEAATLSIGSALAINLSVAFNDPDSDELVYVAVSSNETVATVEIEGDTLSVVGLGTGTTEITVTAKDPYGESASQTFIVTSPRPTTIWYLPSASNAKWQGFVRVINHSDATGAATITATDDAGRTYDPLTLKLEPRHAVSVNAGDLETGNAAKELIGATDMGSGSWRIDINSATLDVEALAYAHTEDGFVSGMNAVATLTDGSVEIPFFNSGSNVDQISLLRLINPSDKEAKATVTGVDDSGASPGTPVQLTLPAGAACTVDSTQLESGTGLACGLSQDGIGDGNGYWRLTVASAAPLVAMNLLSDADGHLTNLSSTATSDEDDMWHVRLFPAASDKHGRQGVVRVINRSSAEGKVSIAATDDSDTEYEALSLTVSGRNAVHFQSDDLELGNEDKDLTGATGSGIGTWRLALSSDSIDIEANAYVRTSDGFLTAMSATAPKAFTVSRVAFFNSGDHDGVSVLRLVNASTDDATVAIDGTDDIGLRPGTTVRVMVPATDAVELTAAQLEAGEADAITSGALGDGTGRWRLRVDGAVTVLSLLSSPSGHLTNLSHADASRGRQSLPAALLPPSTTVTLENVGDRLLRARWSAVEGARYDVDVLKDGIREDIRSLKNTRSTAIRWWYRSPPGTYTIRVRSVNADRVRGPWSALSNEIVFD